MDRLRQICFKLWALWRGRNVDAEMIEEMHAHLDRLIAANRAAGMAPDEARDHARRQFGNMPSLEEGGRDERRFRWLEFLAADLRFGARQLRLNPGFAITAILSLSLGIGASTAIFSAVDAILFRGLPFPHADQLSIVRKGPRGGEPVAGVAPANALEMVQRVRPFAEASPFTATQFVVRHDSGHDAGAERVTGVRVASTFFSTLGVAPALGRDFTAADDRFGAERVAIISSALWRRAFASDPRAIPCKAVSDRFAKPICRADFVGASTIGRTLRAGDEPLTVIGVMHEDFRFPELFGPGFTPEIWTPLAFTPQEARIRGAGYMYLLLKRQNGWPWDAVQRELDAIADAYVKLEPTNYGQEQLRATPLHQLIVGETDATLLLLWAAVTCLLLVGCANTANLILSRSAARSRELAVRASIGASRARLFSQLMAESTLLAGIAGALGLLVAWVLVFLARDALRAFLPRVDEVAIDWRIVAFTIGASWVTSLAVGLIPARRLSSITPRDALNRVGARGSVDGPWATHLRQMLLVGQIAGAVLLGTAAVLLGRSFGEVLRADLGFQPESLLTFELSIPEDAVSRSEVPTIYAELAERMRARPQVISTGALNLLPLGGGDFGWTFEVGDKPVPPGTALPRADVRVVTPGTLETLGVALRGGRSFDRSDRPGGQPVAIVNETLARRVWPGERAIGKQIKLAGPVDFVPWMTVIGVAEDVRFGSPDRAASPAIYRPLGQHAWRDMAIVVRTSGPAAQIAPAIREEVEQLGRGIAVLGVREFSYYLSRSVAGRRLVTTIVGVFAGLSLLLALVGVYGLFAYAVTSRTREIGMRIALGASRGRMVWMLMRDALLLGSLGVAAGITGVFAARQLIQTQLFQMHATDPATLSLVSAVVVATALAACYIPSRRAAFVDPARALRAE